MMLSTILAGFDPIPFEMLKETALSNRFETKFVLSEIQLTKFLEGLKEAYSVVVFNHEPVVVYRTLYYDTAQFDLYLAHHNKRAKRYKVRQRTYLQNNKTFLEVKYQSGNSKVFKERISVQGELTWQDRELNFLTGKLNFKPESLVSALTSSYKRITFVNKTNNERITVDQDLVFSANNTVQKLSKFTIVELKQMTRSLSPALILLKKSGLRPVSLSKYCLGINYLYPFLKSNNFKKRLMAINQLTHAGT